MVKTNISALDAESGASSQGGLGRRLPIRSQRSVANDNVDIFACTSWHTGGKVFGIVLLDRVEEG